MYIEAGKSLCRLDQVTFHQEFVNITIFILYNLTLVLYLHYVTLFNLIFVLHNTTLVSYLRHIHLFNLTCVLYNLFFWKGSHKPGFRPNCLNPDIKEAEGSSHRWLP